jgi:hypothetical protein
MTMQYRPISLLRKIVRDNIVASPAGMYQAIRLRPVDPRSACKDTLLLCQRAQSIMWDMSRIRAQCLDANPSHRSAQTDVVLREEPDEEEDDEEDEGNVTDDEGDDDEGDDGGYSVQVCHLCQW